MIKNMALRKKQKALIKVWHRRLYGYWDARTADFSNRPASRPTTRVGKFIRRRELDALRLLRENHENYMYEKVRNMKFGAFVNDNPGMTPKKLGPLDLELPRGEPKDSLTFETYQLMPERKVVIAEPGKRVPVYWGRYGDPNRKLIGSGVMREDGTFVGDVAPEHADKLFDKSHLGSYSIG